MISHNARKHSSNNKIVKYLIKRFHCGVIKELTASGSGNLVEVGCGEGYVLLAMEHLATGASACDISLQALSMARINLPNVNFIAASILALPWNDRSFDTVLCLEVLEHLKDPLTAVGELARVCKGQLILSVPWEPWFRIGNFVRGQYMRRLGNHPEHIQQWKPHSFRIFLESSEVLKVHELRTQFPWIIAICKPL